MSPPPLRSLENTSRVPAGDQLGAESAAGTRVTRNGSPPAAGIVYRSPPPDLAAAKAIVCPSGDQAGSTSAAGFEVRRRAPVPSASTTYRSSWPAAPLAIAMRLG